MSKPEVLTPVADFAKRIESAIKYAAIHNVTIVEMLGVLALVQVQIAQLDEAQKSLNEETEAK